ncbi:hypothetical protein ACFE04_003153 [Oxalis oulophora]
MFLRVQGCDYPRDRSVTVSIDTKSGEKKYVELITNDNRLDFDGNFIRYFEENLTLLDNDRAVSIRDIDDDQGACLLRECSFIFKPPDEVKKHPERGITENKKHEKIPFTSLYP